jgi:hypothetical protein
MRLQACFDLPTRGALLVTGVSPDRHTSIGHRFMEPPESGIAPPSPNSLNDPQHWRDRAEQARAMAVQMTDIDAIAAMLGVAGDYELLAKRAEERLRESNSAGPG